MQVTYIYNFIEYIYIVESYFNNSFSKNDYKTLYILLVNNKPIWNQNI
jgi:hypothetical protein